MAVNVRHRRHSLKRSDKRWSGTLFVAPSTAAFVVFVGGPAIFGIGLSLFSWDMLTAADFVGTSNFADLFSDPLVIRVLVNTFAFSIASVILHVGLGLLLALGVNRRMNRGLSYFVRCAIFIPFVISWAAVSLTWRQLLDPNFGLAAYYLGLVGLDAPKFFTDPAWALPSIILIDLWHTIGFTFVILLAGLQTVPKELGEAARVDGASPFKVFWHITLPMISPTLFFAMIVTFIGAFQVFDPIQIITNGGPNDSTRTIVMYLYEQGFRSFEIGYASAVAVLMFVVMMGVTGFQFWISRRWVHES